MTRDEINAICASMGWKGAGWREGWVTLPCPLATWRHAHGTDRSPSFAIKCNAPVTLCVCLACDFGGTLVDLFTELVFELPRGSVSRKQAIKVMQGIPVTKLKEPMLSVNPKDDAPVSDPYFPVAWLDQFTMAVDSAIAMKYLADRRVTIPQATAMGLRWDVKYERIGFPIRDYNGNLRGMQGRVLTDAKPKYLFYKYSGVACGHEVLLNENVVATEKPVLLVEGAFDYAALYPYTRQVLVLWGCRVTPQRMKRLERCTKIYTAFDNDKAGDDARERLEGSGLPVTNLKLAASIDDVGSMMPHQLEDLAKFVDLYGTL